MSSHRSYSRRDSPPRRERERDRDRRDSRRSSPGPSRPRSPSSTSSRSLPEQFGRQLSERREDDDGTVLQCMRRSFTNNPLGMLTKCVSGKQKLKVWTRNYKEIRGICTGYIVAFDKHWNMILKEVEEVYLKPAKAKTPYLCDIKSGETLPELPRKVPKKKKDVPKEEEAVPSETEVVQTEPVEEGEVQKAKKPKKKRKKKASQATKRSLSLCFVRGDNIVMVSVVPADSEAEEEPRICKEE